MSTRIKPFSQVRITEYENPRQSRCGVEVSPAYPNSSLEFAPGVLEALCNPRKRRRPGEEEVVVYGSGSYLYLRLSRVDGSAEAFCFETQAEAEQAMRIGMEVDALARREAEERD